MLQPAPLLRTAVLAQSPLLRTAVLAQSRVPSVQMYALVDVAANSAGAVLTGYLAGAAAGPAISSFAALATGVRNGSRSWSELRTAITLATVFSILAVSLARTSLTLGATALSLAPALVQGPLLILMVGIVGGLVPITALLTGTMASPAIPFRDQADLIEYSAMQDSYRSDSWQPPRLWTRPATPPEPVAEPREAAEDRERRD